MIEKVHKDLLMLKV